MLLGEKLQTLEVKHNRPLSYHNLEFKSLDTECIFEACPHIGIHQGWWKIIFMIRIMSVHIIFPFSPYCLCLFISPWDNMPPQLCKHTQENLQTSMDWAMCIWVMKSNLVSYQVYEYIEIVGECFSRCTIVHKPMWINEMLHMGRILLHKILKNHMIKCMVSDAPRYGGETIGILHSQFMFKGNY